MAVSNATLALAQLSVLTQATVYAGKNFHLVFILLVVLYLTQIIYYINFHPLHKVPGPLLARFSGIWRQIRIFRGSWHDDILKLHEEYGAVVRIAPNEVSFVDATALSVLYGHGTNAKKTNWYSTWDQPGMLPSFFAVQDVGLHRTLRSRVSNAYSMSSILSMEPFIQEVADKTWFKFRELSKTGQTINLGNWVQYFTFDVVGQLAFGDEIGFVEKGGDVDDLISAIHNGFYLVASMGTMPLQMFWFNNPLSQFLLTNFGGPKLNAFPNFLKWLEERIKKRVKHGLGDRRKDMLQYFLEMKQVGEQPTGVADAMIEGGNILGAGADTTSIAILAVLGDLILHPEIMSRLQLEVDTAYTALGLNEKMEMPYKVATSLPYLSAVVKESMRLHPSIQFQLPRHASGGIAIGKYYIPESASVGISPRAMNRCQEIFGKDANEFRPSRWIFSNTNEEEAVKQMSRILTTFGMGSRVCIGQNIALVEVYKFIAQFIWNFNVKLADPAKLWTIKTSWFSLQENFNVKLETRRH